MSAIKPWDCKCGEPLNTESMTFRIMKHPGVKDAVFIAARCRHCKKTYLHTALLYARDPFNGFAELSGGKNSL